MKESRLSFIGGFAGIDAKKAAKEGKPQLAFDWDKAAEIIKKHLVDHPDLVAEAGLNGDWDYTGGIIFEDGNPTTEHYTYLSSNWAKPTLIISWDGCEQVEVDCSVVENDRFHSASKWDEKSLSKLGIKSLIK